MTTSNGSPRSSLPSPHQMVETIEDLEQLWQKVVPRSARPVNKGIYERIRRQLVRVQHYVETRATQLTAGAAIADGSSAEGEEEDGEDGDEEEPGLVIVMRILRTLSPEQWEQAKILMEMRRLSDVGRAEMFYELGETHCTDCGAELDPDDPHDDCPAMIEDDDDVASKTPPEATAAETVNGMAPIASLPLTAAVTIEPLG